MKTQDRNWFIVTLWAMAILFIIGLMASCKKPPLASSVEVSQETNTTTVNQSDNVLIERNRAIADSLKIVIGTIRTGMASCDSLCQIELDRVLEQANSSKTSGDNSYGILYDKYKKQLVMYTNLAETVNRINSTSRDSIVYRDKLIKKDIPVIVEYTPWWYKYAAYFGWACLLFLIGYSTLKIRSWIKPKLLS